ncbi:MAG: zf-TFIIB domain-containing protein [Thermoanaerobaculia bacterium]
MKKCPRCGEVLEEIKTVDIYGREISVDRCPQGCGIFFDRYEIFKTKIEEIEKIDNFSILDEKEDKEEFLCPVCSIKMGKYRNPSFKIPFQIDYCNKCHGMWFDRGEAKKFKEIYQEKIKKLKEETKITLKPSVQNFELVAQEEEEADTILKTFYGILKFFFPI